MTKKNILILVLALMALPSFGGVTPTVTLDFESGDRSLDIAKCWDNDNINYVDKDDKDKKTDPIAGNWSGLTVQLNNDKPHLAWLKSPWIIPSAGKISFISSLTNKPSQTRTVDISIIPYSLDAGVLREGEEKIIYTYTYDDHDYTTKEISVDFPQEYVDAGKPCRVLFSFSGKGGSERAYLDNVSIPGTNVSNYSKNCLPIEPVTDRDGDGVNDENDAYPDDRYRAFNNYFPTESSYGTILAEDMWPSRGDYDFNDMVVNYRINSVTNASNQVVEQKYTLILQAIGAQYRNGFGFQLTGVSPTSVRRVTGTDVSLTPYPVPGTEYITQYSFQSNGLESGQTHPTVIVFENAFRVMGTQNVYVNTVPSSPPIAPRTMNVTVTFMENGVPGSGGTVSLTQLSMPNFNPFIVINGDRRREVHQANFPPTSLAVTSVFGMIDDASVPSAGKYYITRANHPWMLNIPEQIPYPFEEVQFDLGYLKFLDWAVSGGVNYPDWYMNKSGYRNPSALY